MRFLKGILFVILIAMVVSTVAFIFYNSSLPPEKSSEQSSVVGDIIAGIIPPETEAGGFIQKYLRKIAHFTEYGLLGVELTLLVLIYSKRRVRHFLLSLTAAVFVALTDETVQMFSKRGPSVYDVWIDVGGFVFFATLTLIVGCAVYLVFVRPFLHRTPRYILIERKEQ